MTITVICPKCARSLKASAAQLGRRAKCPQCGAAIVIAERAPEPPPVVGRKPPPKRTTAALPHSSLRETPAQPVRAKRNSRGYSRSELLGTAFVCLTAGYFIGSLQLIGKVRTLVVETGKALTSGASVPLEGPAPEPVMSGISGSAGVIQMDPPMLRIGEVYPLEGMSVSLTDVRFVPPGDESLLAGGVAAPEMPQIVCRFQITDDDDRKSFTLRPSEMLGPNDIVLSDNTGTLLQRTTPPPGGPNRKGAIHGAQPGEHIEVFEAPSAEAEHLILTINLKVLGARERARFMIPVSQIQGFPVTGP